MIEKRAEDELIPSFKKNNVMLLCHHSLARGILTGKYLPNKSIPEGSRASLSERVSRWLLPEVLNFMQDIKNLSESINCSPTAFVISWLVNNKNVSGILIGSRNKNQLEQIISGVDEKVKEEKFDLVDQLILKQLIKIYKRNAFMVSKNKNLLIIGGANGIGKEAISFFKKQKYNILILDIEDSKNRKNINFLKFDISKIQDHKKILVQIKKKFKKIDCVINFVRAGKRKTIREETFENWNNTMNVNLSGSFFFY